jgi:membrane protein required for colicin V production
MANILVDTTIAVVLFGSAYEGYRRGVVNTLLGLVGFTTVLLLCLAFGEILSKPLKPYIPLPTTYATLAAYILICIVIALIAFFLHGFFSKMLSKKVPPALDAVGGMFAGGLRGVVFTALALLILMLIASPTINDNITNKSRIGSAFFQNVSKVSPTVNEILSSRPSLTEDKDVQKKKGDYELVVDSFQPPPEEK